MHELGSNDPPHPLLFFFGGGDVNKKPSHDILKTDTDCLKKMTAVWQDSLTETDLSITVLSNFYYQVVTEC